MANMIARLGVTLGIDSAEFVRGIDSASDKLEKFGNAAVTYGKIAATALVAASVAALKYADGIVDVAKANEVAVGTVLKLRDALQDNGGEAENAAKMLSSFVGFVDKTADGNLAAQQTMVRLGVSLKDIGNLSITELQDKFIAALGKIEDPITRNALAMEVFGKSAKGTDFVGLAERMAKVNTVTEQQAKAFEDAATVVGIFEKKSRELSVVLVTELGPPLLKTIEYFKEISTEGSGLFGLKIAFQTIAIAISDVQFALAGLQRQTQITLLFFKAFLPGTDVDGQFSKFTKDAEEARAALDKFQASIMGDAGPATRKSDFAPAPGKGGRGTKDAFAIEAAKEAARLAVEAAREAKRIRENDIKIGELSNRQIDERLKAEQKLREEEIKLGENRNRQVETYYKTNEQIKERQTLESLSIDRQRTILNYEQQTRLLREKDKQLAMDIFNIRAQQEDKIRLIQQETNLLEADRQELIASQNALAEKSIELARERNRVMRELEEGDTGKGFNKRMEEFFAFAPTQMQNGAQVFDSVMGNMTSALDNFVNTGKLSFKDLTRSIIQDMIRIQLRAQMISLFSRMFGAGGPASVSSYNASGGISESVFNPAARANGGSINAGMPYMVGERGPEMIIPRSGGTVIPNNQLASNMGGQTNVTNNYINAIDVKSFETKLLESSNTIWAGYQYANKQLASNGRRA